MNFIKRIAARASRDGIAMYTNRESVTHGTEPSQQASDAEWGSTHIQIKLVARAKDKRGSETEGDKTKGEVDRKISQSLSRCPMDI